MTQSDYPVLPPEEESWRPKTATDILLRDRDLAKLGLLAQIEAQCRSALTCAIKGLEHLSYDEWRGLEVMQFKQLVVRLEQRASGIDTHLAELVREVTTSHEAILKHRHQNLHSMWGWNSEIDAPMGIDPKRNEKLYVTGFDTAMSEMAALTFKTKACMMRVGQLIAEGVLVESNEPRGPRICIVANEWVAL